MLHYTLTHDTLAREIATFPYIVHNKIFNDEEIDKIVTYCENKELIKGKINPKEYKSFEQTTNETIRKCDLNFHEKNNETQWIYDKLDSYILFINNEYYGFDLNGYNQFQYTLYNSNENDHYSWHMDMQMGNTTSHQPRKLSLSMCLNDDFEGGKFQMNMGNQDYPIDIELKKGDIIFFPSFMPHRVTPVTKGIRKSVVVWITGPKFI